MQFHQKLEKRYFHVKYLPQKVKLRMGNSPIIALRSFKLASIFVALTPCQAGVRLVNNIDSTMLAMAGLFEIQSQKRGHVCDWHDKTDYIKLVF